MSRLYAILLLAIGLMSFVAVLFQPPEDQVAPAAESAKVQDGKPMTSQDQSDALLLKRDSSGQFHINASLNGTDVRFLVDTGADLVALTEEDAQAIGLTVGEMQPILQTASGVGYGAPVMIDELVVAGVELRNVQAVVAQGLSTNLLGQSVLRKLGGVSLKGDRMVIHPQ
jgi:aspartyl protease family protein